MKAFVADPSRREGVRLDDVDPPDAGPGVVVVAVRASSLNRGEVQHVRKYRLVPDGGALGWDFAGVIVQGATDGSGPEVGQEVYGWSPSRGSWAELLAVPCDHLAVSPLGLSPVDASTLGVAALTAVASLSWCPRPMDEATVIITGATGGVGAFATQLAVHDRARTFAMVRPGTSHARSDLLTGWGARVIEALDDTIPPADLIVDSIGGDTLSSAIQSIAEGGTVVTLGRSDERSSHFPAGWFAKNSSVRGLTISKTFHEPGSTGRALTRLGELVSNGSISTAIDSVVPASDLVWAMNALLDRSISGKVVITW